MRHGRGRCGRLRLLVEGDAFRREFVEPGQDESDREADGKQDEHQLADPGG